MALIKEWLMKDPRPTPVLEEEARAPRTNTFLGLVSTDIKTRVVGVSIGVYKGIKLEVGIILADITDTFLSGNSITIQSDDSLPLVLLFVSNAEATLAMDRILLAGNGGVIN